MKKLIIIFVLLAVSNCFAGKKKVKKESNLKHSYEEYMNMYGGNDTSKAIIELFFDKRENNAAGKMSVLPLSISVSIFAPPIGLVLAGISSPLFISGLITRKRYNHKSLSTILKGYNEKGYLSQRIKKKIKFELLNYEEFKREELTAKRKQILRPEEQISYEKHAVLVVK